MERKPCPYCGEEIAANAKKCRFCGEWLEETNLPASTAMKSDTNPEQPIAETGRAPGDDNHDRRRGNDDRQSQIIMEDRPKGFFETYFWNSLIRKYASFSGLASRKEFWLTYVAMAVVLLGICGVCLLFMGMGASTGILAGGVLSSLAFLALLLPSLAICCRRLRDAGFSPWMILISFIPLIGGLTLLILFCRPSKNRQNPVWTHFGKVDGIIVGVCVVFLGVGIWSMTRSHNEADYSELRRLYEVPDTVRYVEEVVTEMDYDVDTVSYDDYYSAPANSTDNTFGVDESLFDLLISPESVLFGETRLVPLRIGKNYDRVFYETGSTHIQVIGRGMISHNDVSMKCFLTEDGELHGRYRNHTQGLDLDLNGYIQPDGNLYIQLGHDSEKSEWRLHPVSDESPNTYRYEGTWGTNDLWSYVVFREDSDD